MNYKRVFVKNGLIFLTIVTNNRIPVLIKNIENVKNSYKTVSEYYNFDLIAYSIQPEHIHCIIRPLNIEEYPKIIKSFKYSFTRKFNVGLVNPTYKKIWQNILGTHYKR